MIFCISWTKIHANQRISYTLVKSNVGGNNVKQQKDASKPAHFFYQVIVIALGTL